MAKKKSKIDKKILIKIGIVILIIIGIVVYFWISKDSTSASNIPAPPSLPKSN